MSISALSNASALAVLNDLAQSAAKISGRNSTSSGSPTSASAGQSALTGFLANADDPGNAIKAILAQAQIAQAQAAKAQGLAQAPQSQTEISRGPSATVVNARAAYTDQALGDAPLQTTAVLASLDSGEVNAEDAPTAVNYSVTTDFTSTSSGSTSIDSFEANVTIGSKSITIGFALEGLGPLTLDPAGNLSAGNGNLRDFFQIDVAADGQEVGTAFNVWGLDATQAQQLAGVFEDATSAAGSVGSPASSSALAIHTGYSYDGDFGPDFSVNYSMIVGY